MCDAHQGRMGAIPHAFWSLTYAQHAFRQQKCMIYAKVLHKSCIFEHECMPSSSQDPNYMIHGIHSALMREGEPSALSHQSQMDGIITHVFWILTSTRHTFMLKKGMAGATYLHESCAALHEYMLRTCQDPNYMSYRAHFALMSASPTRVGQCYNQFGAGCNR